MSGAPRRWIRLDVDWEDSPWLDALDGTAAGCWPRVLCLVKRSGSAGVIKAPDLGVLARRWRVPRESIDALLSAAQSDGALVVEGGLWSIPKWDIYQKPDLTAAERVKRYRAEKSRLSPLRRNTVSPRHDTPGNGVTRRVTETLTETSTSTDSSPAAPKRKSRTVVEANPLFEELRAEYPKRKGGQGWHDAFQSVERHLRAGVQPAAILEGTKRYAAFVSHEGLEGTSFVKQAATFFGRGRHWTEEWHFNGNGNGRRQERAFLPGSAGSVLP